MLDSTMRDALVGFLLALMVGLPATLMIVLPRDSSIPSQGWQGPETNQIQSNFNPAAALDVSQVSSE